MLRIFLRDNWPLIVGASIGLPISAYLVQQATGQPLLPDLSWLASIFSDIATAAAYTLGLLLFGLLLYAFVVPIVNKIRDRDWQRRQDRATEQQRAIPVTGNGKTYQVVLPGEHPAHNLALQNAQAKIDNLQKQVGNLQDLLGSFAIGLSTLCEQVTGKQEPDPIRAIKVLERAFSEQDATIESLGATLDALLEAPQEPTGAPSRVETGPLPDSALAALDAYLLATPKPKIKEVRAIIRDNGGYVGRDYQEFTEMVKAVHAFTLLKVHGSQAENAPEQAADTQEQVVGEQASPAPPRRVARKLLMRKGKR